MTPVTRDDVLRAALEWPFVMERHDEDDGSISWEIWDHRPDSYRRLLALNDSSDSAGRNAKPDAKRIVDALNADVLSALEPVSPSAPTARQEAIEEALDTLIAELKRHDTFVFGGTAQTQGGIGIMKTQMIERLAVIRSLSQGRKP